MENNNLVRLAYFSTSEKILSNEELLSMLTRFRQKNSEFNICGLLIYCEDCFFQVIEGNKTDIEQLWRNIVKDKSHSLVTQILKCPIYEKSYAEWSMAFTRFRHSDEVDVEGFKDLLDLYQTQKIAPNCENKIAEIIYRFSRSQKKMY